MEKAIKKAIEGGYYDGIGTKPTDKGVIKISAMIYNKKFLLDPLFWQALGKAEGWGKTKEEKEMKGESLLSLWKYEWQVYWHCFIDHIASGGDINKFFEELL